MSDVLEVRPGTIRPGDLAVFERVLEQVPSHVGGTPCLVGPDGVTIELPADIHALLVSIIENLKAGNGVTVIPMHAELTTVEAAQLLNVSRPFLIKQLDAGVLAHHMVAPTGGCGWLMSSPTAIRSTATPRPPSRRGP